MTVTTSATQPSASPWGRRRPPLPRRLRARLAVAAARALATQPPARIRALLTAASRGAAPASRQTAQRARDDVTAVSLVCRGQRGCVPRSVATALVCRLSGSWPTWCVGVRTVAPFAAHAWVEADGLMVGEDEPAGYFRPLLTVPPRRPVRPAVRTVADRPPSPAAVPTVSAFAPGAVPPATATATRTASTAVPASASRTGPGAGGLGARER